MIRSCLAFALFCSFATGARAYDESFVQPSAGSQFYQEGASHGKPINEAGCFPTSLAYAIRYQKFVQEPGFPNLLAPAGATASAVDATEWMKYFYHFCGVTEKKGTNDSEEIPCIRHYYEQSGYPRNWVYMIGAHSKSSPRGESFKRAATPKDFRNYLRAGYSIVLSLSWLDGGDHPNEWTINGGHAVAVIGYEYDRSWAEDKILLKIMDPAQSYYGHTASQSYTTIRMESLRAFHPDYRIKPAPGAEVKYLVSDFGYNPDKFDTVGLVDDIDVFAPEEL